MATTGLCSSDSIVSVFTEDSVSMSASSCFGECLVISVVKLVKMIVVVVVVVIRYYYTMTIKSQPSQDSSLYVVVGHNEGVEFRQVLL